MHLLTSHTMEQGVVGPACNLSTREVRARGSYLSIAKKIRISVSVGKVVEKENSCPPLVGSVNSCITLESGMDALQMLTEPPYNPAIPLVGKWPTDRKSAC